MEKQAIKCQICESRKEPIAELNKIKQKYGAFVREKRRTNTISMEGNGKVSERGYVEKMDECSICRKKGEPTAISDFGANFEQTQHIHKCGLCGSRFPENEDKVYKGTFVCSDLGDQENGELYIIREVGEPPIKKMGVENENKKAG